MLFNRFVGLASALALCSSTWFLYRARSGNLDIPLTFFFLLTVYLSIKAYSNRKFFLPFCLSLTYLILIKASLPFTIIPTLAIIFSPTKLFNILNIFSNKTVGKIVNLVPKDTLFSVNNKIYRITDLLLPIILITLFFGGWLLGLYLENPGLLQEFFRHGQRGVGLNASYLQNLQTITQYLHNGIGKWYWPGLISIFLSIFFFQKRFIILTIFFISYMFPFIFSSIGELWHLIPVYPIMILSFFGFFSVLLEFGSNVFVSIFKRFNIVYFKIISELFILCIAFIYFFIQSQANWNNFVNIPAYFSDEAILSRDAGVYPYNFYIDGADFTPTAAFYSGKKVQKIWEGGLPELFESQNHFVLITHQWRLDKAKIPSRKYLIIAKDRDKILIMRNEKKNI